MISRLRSRFGTAGLVVAITALVVALAGGAYAASGKLTPQQKKEVKKIAQTEAKKFAGEPGAPGAQGPQGPAGTAGTAGAAGTPGAAGKSVEVGTEATGTGNCEGRGGATVQVAGEAATKKYACNGKQGTAGAEGSPWTLGGTVPPEKTLTGVWGAGPGSPAGSKSFEISFPLPLTEAPAVVIVGPTEETKPGCPGRGGGTFTVGYIPKTPKADPGKLCIYVMANGEGAGTIENALTYEYEAFNEFAMIPGASTSGTILTGSCSSVCALAGSWAVTAPAE